MRTKNAFMNMISSLISHFVSMFIGFFVQAIFVKNLGTEYLGINGLFSNIFSMLGVVELGIGSSIIYNLYKPIAQNNKEKIKSLMNFYKKCYRIIALIIFIFSLIIFPFLSFIVGDTTINLLTIRIIFLLFMLDIICSYLLTYKRSILYASQKNYIIDFIHIGYLLILNTVHVIILLFTKNYILYLLFKIFMRLLENIVITIYVNKKYKFLKEKSEKLDVNTIADIKQKVKGLLFHKVGVFFVSGTDNIIISSFLGISVVGMYSNYNMIISALNTVINQIFSSFKSSIGNLLVTNDNDKIYLVYKRMQFLNFWFAMMASVGLLIVMDSFITIWLGSEFILPKSVLIVLTIYDYVYISKLCISSFKEAAGIFYEDRFIPLLESVVNIVVSIILVKLIGLPGVFIGTICCQLITHLYTYPKIVYKKLYNKEAKQYFVDNIKYLIITLLVAGILSIISTFLIFNNNLITLISNVLLVLIIPNIIIILLFHKTEEFQYYKNLIFQTLNKTISKLKKVNS